MCGKYIISVAYPQYFLSKDFIKSPPPPPQRTLRFTPIRLHGTPSFASGGGKKRTLHIYPFNYRGGKGWPGPRLASFWED